MKLDQLEHELEKYGEIAVVLDSGVEYELHLHDTKIEKESEEHAIIETRGIKHEEFQIARFPSSTVEHIHYHKEN